MGNSEDLTFWKVLDWIKSTLSTLVTLGFFGLILYAITHGYASLDGHPVILLLIFFFVVTLLAYLEGLQIAIMELQNENRREWRHMKRAYNNHKLATANHGLNVQRFLVGRQFFVVFVVFLAAQLTTYSELEINWLPDFLYVLIIQTGMPGVLFVLSFGQLMPQLIASTHPVTFMDLPGSWWVIKMALMFETMGVTHFSWVLTIICKFIFKLNTPDITSKAAELSQLSRISRASTLSRVSRKRTVSRVAPRDDGFDSFVNDDDFQMTVSNVCKDSLVESTANEQQAEPEQLHWLHHQSVQNAFNEWGFKSSDARKWPTAEEVVRHLHENNKEIPCYLLPTSHPMAIAPHIVVMEIEQNELKKKMN